MALDGDAIRVQMLYPRVYMACHTDHVRAASSEAQLSSRDSAILAHLSVGELRNPTGLARHLKVSPSTLSEALAKLSELGYVRIRRDEADERRQKLELTPKGLDAMSRTSVLDYGRVVRLLERLSAKDRKRAIEGLALLADAALEA